MLTSIYLLVFILIFSISPLHAQLCQGSLGDPIININFGAGSNPGAVLSTTKNLNYSGSDCPNDGWYTVRNNTSRCFGNTWHTVNSDHTGNPNGYFMLINASLQKSEFYIDTLTGLCPGTTYEFAAWVMNVIILSSCGGNTIKPNLTFNIEKTDGTVLQTYASGDITPTSGPVWNQYGFFFTTPAATNTIVLRLINNSTGGCGNDIAIDDITFRPCGPKLTPSIKGVPGSRKDLCVGNNSEVVLQCDVSAGYTNPSYAWQESKDGGATWINIPGETSNTMIRKYSATTPASVYLYRFSVGEASNIGLSSCKVASAILTVSLNAKPVVSIPGTSPVCQGKPLILSSSPQLTGAVYAWSGANAFSDTGIAVTISNIQPINAGKYYLAVTSSEGCKILDSTEITVTLAPVIKTAFSNKLICQGESVVLGASGGDSYLWFPAIGLSATTIPDPVANPSVTTVYQVETSNTSSCTASASVTINVISRPVADAGPDKTIIEGQTVKLDGAVSDSSASITWAPALFIDNIHIPNPTVNPATNTSYILTATAAGGCGTSSDTVEVVVYKKIIIPNAFSPNGDGINDTWNIPALLQYRDYRLLIFNRYGQQLYETRDYSQPWKGTVNGKLLAVGTYYYLLDLGNNWPKFSGYVLILK